MIVLNVERDAILTRFDNSLFSGHCLSLVVVLLSLRRRQRCGWGNSQLGRSPCEHFEIRADNRFVSLSAEQPPAVCRDVTQLKRI
jgi:hypothetical protein